MADKSTSWKRIWTIGGITVVALLLATITVVTLGYLFDWKWTGLRGASEGGPKTLWDWLDLLIIPVVLGAGAWWIRKGESEIARESEKHSAKLAQETEVQRAREAAFEAYLDKMSDLLLHKDNPLKNSKLGDPILDLAQVRTVTILRRLGIEGRNRVLQFLHDAGLHGTPDLTQREIDLFDGIPLASARRSMYSQKEQPSLLANSNLAQSDFSSADLSHFDLNSANLSQANLSGANLKCSRLQRANLSKAQLADANLTWAVLSGANLAEVDLTGLNLEGADLVGAHLRGADLSSARLQGANLMNADLIDANLRGANLTGADLSEANLAGANLALATLFGADFINANLSGADLSNSRLCECAIAGFDVRAPFMNGARMMDTVLLNTNLTGTDLSEVEKLTCAQIESAKGEPAALPDYIPESCTPKPIPRKERLI